LDSSLSSILELTGVGSGALTMAVTDSSTFSTLGLTGASAVLAYLAGLPFALGFTSVAAT